MRLKDTLPADEFKSQVSKIAGYTVERVGMTLGVNGIAVENASGDAATFAACAKVVKNAASR